MTFRIVNAREKKFTLEEFRMLAEIEEHPEVAKWDIPAYGGDVERASLGFKESIERLSITTDEFLLATLNKRIVGFAGIHRLKGEIDELSHVGEIGLAVHPDFQRRGIGTRLLKTCVTLAKKRGFKRLEADTMAHNVAMRRALEKARFRLEGVRQKRIKMSGRYFDEACYAKLT